MLKLVDIKKDYVVADSTVQALKGISLEFRKNEFVSILGQSGCGKTTLLNIIGGLDKYTSGDLIICGKSTKDYKDRDWDVYRNHRIGFIFQSYNLIPHQTILANVELALTIGGMSASERKKKAEEALKRVGLGGQIKKYPNQLSGGQMQRVAIARALVNDPEILLADEPTGALDTKTSIQIMELIKEIAKERLVIMVTHNPELAMQYSTRIVRLLDGQVVEDSAPYDGTGEVYEEQRDKTKATNMSFATSLLLSAKNLWSKKGRTAVTSIAGSIGIIGVCAVLALSAGIHGYIDGMQDDMLSGNPISVSETALDYNTLTSAMSMAQKTEVIKHANDGKVYIDSYISSLAELGSSMANMMVSNTITKDYVEYIQEMPKDYYAAILPSYGVDVLYSIYTDFSYRKSLDSYENNTERLSIAAIQEVYTQLLKKTDYKEFTSYLSYFTNIFAQAPDNAAYIESQYDIVEGRVATKKNELMVVLSDNSELTDITLAQLGYITQEEFLNYAFKAVDDPHYDEKYDVTEIPAKDILNKTFTWYPNDSIYRKNYDKSDGGIGQVIASTHALGQCSYEYMAYDEGLENGLELKVVGVLRPKETISYGCLSSGVYYTQALAEYAVEQNLDSEIAKYAKEQGGSISSGEITALGVKTKTGVGYKYHFTYDGELEDGVGFVGFTSNSSNWMSMMSQLMGGGAGGANGANGGAGSDDSEGEYSYSVKSMSLRKLGGEEIPNRIYIYPIDFESKALVTDYLDGWNDTHDSGEKVTYSDSLELIISMINQMIDIITYGLIAFTSISLVVSSVMIGVVTYVSVVERTKEIGVLRSLGARKLDVSNLFNAETFIIGLLSGLVGVLFTYLISIPANLILHALTNIWGLVALPWEQALLMICISFLLTMISGLIPARAAAKKDPVIALRTE